MQGRSKSKMIFIESSLYYENIYRFVCLVYYIVW